jgi:DNA (cytosine-5)-methyltransferase 1
MRGAYYNEIEPYAVEWLRRLVLFGLVAPGDVDDRSIKDVDPDDLRPYCRCHFFAGIGLWDLALERAGWSADCEVWTGSCPCQPFSASGQQGGFDDPRHLWPDWFRLIDQHRPDTIFGEQVAAKAGLDWFDLVSTDLEGAGYAVGATDLGAAGLGAPHIRQRLWFVAFADGVLDDAESARSQGGRPTADRPGQRQAAQRAGGPRHGSVVDAESQQAGLPRRAWFDGRSSFWADADWILCRDDKWRPVEPSTFPLAHGYPARVGKLRAYGNAICPQVAQAFIEAAMECRP